MSHAPVPLPGLPARQRRLSGRRRRRPAAGRGRGVGAGEPPLVGRRGAGLPGRARHRSRRRRLPVVPRGAARGRRAPARGRRRAAGPGDRLRLGALRPVAAAGRRGRRRVRPLRRDAGPRRGAEPVHRDRRPAAAGRRRRAAVRRRQHRRRLLGLRRAAVRRRRRGRAGRGGAGCCGPGGRFVASVNHPCAGRSPTPPTPRTCGSCRPTSTGRRTSRPTTTGATVYVEHHRTVGDWVRAVVGAGLVLEDLVEPEWTPGRTQEWGQWSPERGALVPGTLILCASRPSGPPRGQVPSP